MPENHKPLVLIAPSTEKKGVEFSDISINLSECYPRAIIAAGGVPAMLSCTPLAEYVAESVERADGVLMTGGDDIQPRLHTTSLDPHVEKTVSSVEPGRDLFELMLIQEIFRQRKLLFAICRGHQIVNVAFGGTLFVDLPLQYPSEVAHKRYDRKNEPVHEVKLESGSLIERLMAVSSCGVNSTHHQAVAAVAKPFRATALAPDGVIEALELAPADRALLPWFLAVQFHPERLFQAYPRFLELFRGFVAACGPARAGSV